MSATAPVDAPPQIAVVIPCLNEERTIGKVIDDFRAELPGATIYVFDNCCTDNTTAIARDKGAIVIKEPRPGKGFAVESMLRRVRADYYVMVDGDDTYPADKVGDLLRPVLAGEADMAVGSRLSQYTDKSFRPLHVAGNGLVRWLVNWIFHGNLSDILSGFRAFNSRVSQAIPLVSAGFEVETELTIQMLYYQLKIVEVVVPYRERPVGSQSKLRTFRDGGRVLWKIFTLLRSCKPLVFFGAAGVVLFVLAILAGIPPVYGFVESGYREVKRIPLAVLATGLMVLSAGTLFLGVILHAMNWRFRELHNIMTRAGNQGVAR
jgi:glycosyltransferase involved in cell wall biosynthesis